MPDQDKYKQYHTGCDQCFSVKSGCISHLDYNICRQRTYPSEDPLRQARLIASYHNDRHRLSNGTADSQDDRRNDARLCCGNYNPEDRPFVSCPERNCAFIVLIRHCADRRFCQSDNGRQNHHSQKQRCCQDTASVAAESQIPSQRPDQGYNHHQSEKAIDY